MINFLKRNYGIIVFIGFWCMLSGSVIIGTYQKHSIAGEPVVSEVSIPVNQLPGRYQIAAVVYINTIPIVFRVDTITGRIQCKEERGQWRDF